MFELHAQLAADTKTVDDWELCRVLLMDDARYPWLILVPRIEGLRDFDEVPAVHKWRFFEEIELASRALRETSGAEKMNVAALGNMVPQLHVHVVARFEGDAAWPKPVWGVGEAEPYGPGKTDLLIGKLNVTVARLAVG